VQDLTRASDRKKRRKSGKRREEKRGGPFSSARSHRYQIKGGTKAAKRTGKSRRIANENFLGREGKIPKRRISFKSGPSNPRGKNVVKNYRPRKEDGGKKESVTLK